jgi:hypothetical protein
MMGVAPEPRGLRWLAPVLGAAAFALLLWGFGFRGVAQSGLDFTDAALRVAAWFHGQAPASSAWKGAWPPLTLGTVGGLVAMGMGPLRAGHLVSALSIALSVPLVWGLGRRAGGPPGAFGAVAVFVLTPRIIGLGTTVGPGASAVCGFVFAVYALYRARRSVAWTVAAPFALALAILNGQAGLLLIPLWVALTVTDKGLATAWLQRRGHNPLAPPGFVQTASFPARLLVVPLVAIPLVIIASPAVALGVGAWLQSFFLGWLEQPQPAFVYLDDLVTGGRVPWHAGPVLMAATLTPVAVVLGAAGVGGEVVVKWVRASPVGRLLPDRRLRPDPEAAGPEAREAKRWVFAALCVALVAPWLAGRPSVGGVDFIALGVPFIAVFAGCTLSRLITRAAHAIESRDLPIPRRVPLAVAVAAFGTFVFVPAAVDCARSYPATEAYYNLFVGGAEGAVQKGLGRNPAPVAPVVVARRLAAQTRDGTAGFLVAEGLWRRTAHAYTREGLCPPLSVVAPAEADVVLLTHADNDPAYFQVAPLFAASTRVDQTTVWRGGRLRLFSMAPAKTESK